MYIYGIDGYEQGYEKKCVHVIILRSFSDEEEVRGVKVEKKEKCFNVEVKEKDVEVKDIGCVSEVCAC